MKKTLLIISLIIITLLILLFSIIALPWILIYIGLLFESSPPAPDIKYAEFPFRLEYEEKESKFTIKDSLICEYNGIGFNEGTGKYHKWKEYLMSGKEEIILTQFDDNNRIIYSIGCPVDYMEGNEVNYQLNYNPYGAIKFEKDGRFTTTSGLEPEDLINYQIKILSIELKEPNLTKP